MRAFPSLLNNAGGGANARAARRITADILNWVHTVPAEKPAPVLARNLESATRAGGLLGSFWSALSFVIHHTLYAPNLEGVVRPPVANMMARVTLNVWAANGAVRMDETLGQELSARHEEAVLCFLAFDR
jgi:hypothetical protein